MGLKGSVRGLHMRGLKFRLRPVENVSVCSVGGRAVTAGRRKAAVLG